MLNFGLLGGNLGGVPPGPAECIGADICMNVGNDGTTAYGFHSSVGYGTVTPPTFGGVTIFALVFFDDGSGLCVASMGDGTEQLPGITSLDFTWGTYGAVGYTWNAVNLRYEANDVGLIAYIKAELGNNVGGSAVPTNLILNPTFNVDLLNWTATGPVTVTRAVDRFSNGGARLEATGTGSKTFSSTAVNLIVGQVYDVECDCFEEIGNPSEFIATISLVDNTVLADPRNGNLTIGAVEHLKFSFTATNTTEQVFLSLLRVANYWASAGSVVTYDNISIKLQ